MNPCVCVPGLVCELHSRVLIVEIVLESARAALEDAALAWGEHQDGLVGRVGGLAGASTLHLRSRVLMAARAFSVASRRAAVGRIRAAQASSGAGGDAARNEVGSSGRTDDIMSTGV